VLLKDVVSYICVCSLYTRNTCYSLLHIYILICAIVHFTYIIRAVVHLSSSCIEYVMFYSSHMRYMHVFVVIYECFVFSLELFVLFSLICEIWYLSLLYVILCLFLCFTHASCFSWHLYRMCDVYIILYVISVCFICLQELYALFSLICKMWCIYLSLICHTIFILHLLLLFYFS